MTTDQEPIACPECGATYWKRIASGTYTAREYIETDGALAIVMEDDERTERMDVSEWECFYGHVADDDTSDELGEMEGA